MAPNKALQPTRSAGMLVLMKNVIVARLSLVR
ncbi:hypothetical protein NIES970_24720 [[Synechococcus] sp. NIES-970]|nr:hypothetical protein NIES970_24720 [[Synechococcus] sp. NIES-970]